MSLDRINNRRNIRGDWKLRCFCHLFNRRAENRQTTIYSKSDWSQQSRRNGEGGLELAVNWVCEPVRRMSVSAPSKDALLAAFFWKTKMIKEKRKKKKSMKCGRSELHIKWWEGKAWHRPAGRWSTLSLVQLLALAQIVWWEAFDLLLDTMHRCPEYREAGAVCDKCHLRLLSLASKLSQVFCTDGVWSMNFLDLGGSRAATSTASTRSRHGDDERH